MSEAILDKFIKTSIIFILLILFFILFTNISSADSNSKIIINEVMYDSEEDDNYYEYIELYNPTNKEVNLSGWTITDNTYQDFLEPDTDHGSNTYIIPERNYAIITDHGTKIYEKYNVSSETTCFYVDDKSIGNGLGNTKDKLILKDKKDEQLDSMEWGYDYSDVPGSPANLTQSGFTLSRASFKDTNDSSKDFHQTTPTLGYKNTNIDNAKISIILGPEYVPKITKNNDFSLPFAFKIQLSGFQSDENYDVKSFIVGNQSNIYPATQTWNVGKWDYSNYYTKNIQTNSNGNISFWTVLRFNKGYKEYSECINHNKNCFFSLKIKKDDKVVKSFSQKLSLLELEKTTDNGFQGGYISGSLDGFDDKIIVVEDKTGIVNSVYFTEDNNIDEGLISKSGYYKTYSPVGENNKIKFYDKKGFLLHTIEDVFVQQGENDLELFFEYTLYRIYDDKQLKIKTSIVNNGDFNDSVSLEIFEKPGGWNVFLENDEIFLESSDSKDVFLYVKPNPGNTFFNGEVKIQTVSGNDPGLIVEDTVCFEVMSSDLTVKKIKILDESKTERSVFGCGETIKFKAFVRNLGNLDGENVDVCFYFEEIKKTNLIGSRFYENIGEYQKYPSVWWDTKNVLPGRYEIIVLVDDGNYVDELCESNNRFSVYVDLYSTSPDVFESSLLISEFYYHSHPNLKNEYICIYNPCNRSIDISSFYITDEPFKNHGEQNKLIFPEKAYIKPNEKIIVTENAETYFWETNKKSDFEYNKNSKNDIPQMNSSKKMVFSNTGESIAFKNSFNHTIDFISYGEQECFIGQWNGTSIPLSGEGVVLKRNFNKETPVDTNTKTDWMNNRVFKIGQSNFETQKFCFNGIVQPFVSPDNSYQILTKLIQNAKSSIYINMYEFTNFYLCDELLNALKRNVSVFLFCEGEPIGGISDEEKYILHEIKKYGGKIHFITNNHNENIYSRYRFNHAKYAIIDNKTLVLESCNWAPTGVPKPKNIGNREWGIIVYNQTITKYFSEVFKEDSNINRCDVKSFEELNLSISENFVFNHTIFQGFYKNNFTSNKINSSFTITPVLSPDNSVKTLLDFIESAEKSIYIQQLYIYKNWDGQINPIVEKLVEKAEEGIKIKIILNYNPIYQDTNTHSNHTKTYLEKHGVKVKFFYTNWSYFTNIHNKGVIIDNKSVLISSLNWNENSFTNNRETGLIVENNEIALYFSEIFFYDWNLRPESDNNTKHRFVFYDDKDSSSLSALDIGENDNTIYIVFLFTLTFALIAMDWRKRKWR